MFEIDLSHDDKVANICLNRPEVHNAFNDELIKDLTKELRRINSDESIRVVILSGKGKSFCAGADLNWMKKMKGYSLKDNIDDSKKLHEMLFELNKLEKFVLGKVHGAALGGGVGLVACCDHVVALEEAKFGLTEVKLGLIPAVISPFVINKIGPSLARAYFMNGERFNGKRAKEMNLVHQTVADLESLDASIDKQVSFALSCGPKSVALAKELIFQYEALQREGFYQYTCELIAKQRVSGEGQEGMSALLEKRAPRWNG